MTRTPERLIEERMRAMLLLVARRSCTARGTAKGAVLSLEELAAALRLSVPQVRCVLRRLVAGGLVDKRPRFLSNGGQLENAFLVTPAGYAFLLEEAAPSGKEQEASFAEPDSVGIAPRDASMNGAR